MYIILFCWRHDFHFDESISYSLLPGDNDNIAIFIEHLFSEKAPMEHTSCSIYSVKYPRRFSCSIQRVISYHRELYEFISSDNIAPCHAIFFFPQFPLFFRATAIVVQNDIRDRVILCTDGVKELNSAHR